MINITPLQIARFWMNVKENKESKCLRDGSKWLGYCWTWNGSLLLSGYGRFGINYKIYRAHRISYYIYNGRIAKDKFICHTCDNPRCVNPKHLFEGTTQENTQDKMKKGRYVKRGKSKSKCIGKAKSKHASSKFYGVYYRKDNKKWRARYMIDGKNHYIGQFDTQIEAAKAYNKEVVDKCIDWPLNKF